MVFGTLMETCMNLWDELANNTVCEGPRQLEDDLAYYLVCDTLDRDVEGCRVLPRTVLLCESPHTDEVIHGHPLAGSSPSFWGVD